MAIVNRMRLVALSEREFSREAETPQLQLAPKKFRAVPLKLARYDATWDRRRG